MLLIYKLAAKSKHFFNLGMTKCFELVWLATTGDAGGPSGKI